MGKTNDHAIVVGGSIGGLLGAKVLSNYYKKVTIIERDPETAISNLLPRDGVPQGQFFHLMIPKGLSATEQLIPNFIDRLIAKGAHEVDFFNEFRRSDIKDMKVRFKSEKKVMLMSRILLEDVIRSFIIEIPNIEFMYHTVAKGLLSNAKENEITGVRLTNLTKHEESILHGDLVVDASGASTLFPEWLDALGYDKPVKTELEIDYIQLVRRYQVPTEFQPDWKCSVYRAPTLRKEGQFSRIEDTQTGPQWSVSFTRHFGEPIESDEKGFLKYAQTILDPDLYEVLEKSKPITPIRELRVPKAWKYNYSTLKRLPKGFIAMGDALCLWPPATGLGITMAVEVALIIDSVISKENMHNLQNNNRSFFIAAEKHIEEYWNLKINMEFKSLINPGKGFPSNFINWYKDSISSLCNEDPKVLEILTSVATSEKHIRALFQPAVFSRVLKLQFKKWLKG